MLVVVTTFLINVAKWLIICQFTMSQVEQMIEEEKNRIHTVKKASDLK